MAKLRHSAQDATIIYHFEHMSDRITFQMWVEANWEAAPAPPAPIDHLARAQRALHMGAPGSTETAIQDIILYLKERA